jgi:hypothetical protein
VCDTAWKINKWMTLMFRDCWYRPGPKKSVKTSPCSEHNTSIRDMRWNQRHEGESCSSTIYTSLLPQGCVGVARWVCPIHAALEKNPAPSVCSMPVGVFCQLKRHVQTKPILTHTTKNEPGWDI